jgi:hypothetical protein
MSSDPFSENEDIVESEGEETGKSKKKLLLVILLGALVGGGLSFYFYSQKEVENINGVLYEPEETTDSDTDLSNKVDTTPPDQTHLMQPAMGMNHEEKLKSTSSELNVNHHVTLNAVEKPLSAPAGEVPILILPENNSQWRLDGTSEYPAFTWKSGQSSTLRIAKDPKVEKNIEVEHQTREGRYEIRSILPGQYYWKVANASGVSEIRSFMIQPAVKRKISLKSPSEGSSVSGQQVEFLWHGDEKVRLYKVQYSVSPTLFDPIQEFLTVATQMTVSHLPKGLVWVRIGAFSLVSEQWEYTDPVKITVD